MLQWASPNRSFLKKLLLNNFFAFGIPHHIFLFAIFPTPCVDQLLAHRFIFFCENLHRSNLSSDTSILRSSLPSSTTFSILWGPGCPTTPDMSRWTSWSNTAENITTQVQSSDNGNGYSVRSSRWSYSVPGPRRVKYIKISFNFRRLLLSF